ncbi:MAG: hypothetical protein A2Z18_02395 [Armatimonadetes bacterium RBG_16_58_9]|nr:MAG: hypothetical protein A2Z18_02395 [Armatimonadetes bacterium RBG_16_58_9]
MVRVCKPGGVVIVSVYSRYCRCIHRWKQRLINWLAGSDIEQRYRWGKRLFPITARQLKLRAHDKSDAVLYDQFSQPHESVHTVGEILNWYDQADLAYLGAFGPLRIRDYVYTACLPEYKRIETTFAGYPVARLASSVLKGLAKICAVKPRQSQTFPRPSKLSEILVQVGWFFMGLRFSCFSIAGRKAGLASGREAGAE